MAEEYRSLCKDCGLEFGYSGTSLQAGSTRGLSRPERCPACRRNHSRESRSIGIPQIKIKPTGPRKPDKDLSPGRLGKIDHPERFHKKVLVEGKFGRTGSHIEFGITDDDIRRLITTMQKNQVTVVVGPTGSGKSTFLPYRLMVPPEEIEPDVFTRYGQIVITQPRIQATRNIAKFVAEDLHGCTLGAGFDVGFRHKDAPASDWRNKLVYVTDGTLINWIVSGQISNLSVIMIDEAHERSVNIDLILGLLRKQLPRFAHLKLIIASATINARLFQNYFGGSEKVEILQFKGLKQHRVDAYFPDHHYMLRNDQQVPNHMARMIKEILLDIFKGEKSEGDILGFLTGAGPIEKCVSLLRRAIVEEPELKECGIDVYPLYTDLHQKNQDLALAKKTMVTRDKTLEALRAKDNAGPWKIAVLLLDQKSAQETWELINQAYSQETWSTGWVITLLDPEQHLEVLLPNQVVVTTHEHFARLDQRIFDQTVCDRRVVISTNVAETSLTVDGIAYVVDSGLIKQASWDPKHSAKELTSIFHSRAGCRQRWGRAGRVRDGEVHLLYTDAQFEDDKVFPSYSTPEIQRISLEQVILQSKAAGIGMDEITDPAKKFWIQEPPEEELKRAPEILKGMGALDAEGDLTEYGMELNSYITPIPVADLLVVADQYAFGLEMATLAAMILCRLHGGLLQWSGDWDFTSREQVEMIQGRFASFCLDDLELYLKIYSLWSEAESEEERGMLCRLFFIDQNLMETKVASDRGRFLEMLSIGKKEEEDRTINFDYLDRLRMVLAASVPLNFIYRKVQKDGKEFIVSLGENQGILPMELDEKSVLAQNDFDLFLGLNKWVAFNRAKEKIIRLSGLVGLKNEWVDLRNLTSLGLAREIADSTKERAEDIGKTRHRLFVDANYPLGARFKIERDSSGNLSLGQKLANPEPFIPAIAERTRKNQQIVFEETDTEILPLAGWEDKADQNVSYTLEEEQSILGPREDAEEDGSMEVDPETNPLTESYLFKPRGLIKTSDVAQEKMITPRCRWEGVAPEVSEGVVVDYLLDDPGNPALLLRGYDPVQSDSKSEMGLTPGTRVTVEVVRIKENAKGEKALWVKENKTGRDFVVDAPLLSFWGRWDLADEFLHIPSFEMTVVQSDGGSLRLSSLPLVEAVSHKFIRNNREDLIEGRLIEARRELLYFLLKDEKPSAPGIFLVGFFRKPQGLRKIFEIGKSHSFTIDSKTGWADVAVPFPTQEFLTFIEQESSAYKIKWNSKRFRLQTLRPMTSQTLEKLLSFFQDKETRGEILWLYRESNRIVLRLPKKDRREINIPRQRAEIPPVPQKKEIPDYSIGEVVSGRVIRIREDQVELSLDKGGEGIIPLAHLSWERLRDPKEKVQTGDRLEAKVISRDGGRVYLSLLNEADCPGKKIQIGRNHFVRVYKVESKYALAKLEETVIGLIPLSEVDNEIVIDVHRYLRPGKNIKVKVIRNEIDFKDLENPLKIEFSIKQVTKHQNIKIPETKFGLLIGKKGESIKKLKAETGCSIWLDDKKGIVDISSKFMDRIDMATERVKKLIPEMEIVSKAHF